jgi:hypothetical protein
MKPFPDFDTSKGIRAVADYLELQAETPHPDGAVITVGHMKIRATIRGCLEASSLLRKKAAAAGKPKSGAWVKPPPWIRQKTETRLQDLDAVRVCGTPEAALETIERQLATQGEYMESADVARCQKAAFFIQQHLVKEKERAAVEARNTKPQ